MSGLNHDKLKSRRQGRSGSGWKPKNDDNRIRILPPHSRYLTAWDTMEDLSRKYKMHYFRVEGRPTEVSRCLEDLTPKQKCPACDAWRAHRKSSVPAMAELAKQIAPADSYLFNILDIANLAAGVQVWSANYTCWDKIMEIAANPAWGNVVDPTDGVCFVVRLVPANQSRTGYNSYSVVAEPQRTTVMPVLEQIPNWQAALDTLEEHITPAKTASEIAALVGEMGLSGAAMAVPAPQGVVSGTATPPPAVVVPGARAAVAQAPVAVAPAPVSVAPAPVSVAPVAVAPVAVAPVAVAPAPAAVAPAAAVTVHYDPGPSYVPKVSDAERPAGVPRCFGDYDPARHQCPTCPAIADCQLKMLG